MLSRKLDPNAFARALAERLTELLPPDRFKVETNGDSVAVRARDGGRHSGSVLRLTGSVMLALPVPVGVRLRIYFENQAASVQEFVSRLTESAWPASGAKPHVRVTETEVHVGYALPAGDMVLAWRPVDRVELGA